MNWFDIFAKQSKVSEGYNRCDDCGAIVPNFTPDNGDEVWAAHDHNCMYRNFARAFRSLDYEYGLRKELPKW